MRATYGMTMNDFEHLWQQRTRRRYGALALVGDVTFGGFILLVVIVPLYAARRYRDRKRLAALLAADEAAERASRTAAIEALLAGDDEPDFRDGAPPAASS
jgi:nitrate/nitrite transporter NarK